MFWNTSQASGKNKMTAWREEENFRYYEKEFEKYLGGKYRFVTLVANFCILVISYLRKINEQSN